MVSTRLRADSRVSSTATRAPRPSASFTKSMFSACSSGTWEGGEYETLPWFPANQPSLPLPLPLIFAWWVIMVHIVILLTEIPCPCSFIVLGRDTNHELTY